MIVVDTNVLAHFFIQGEKTAFARRLHAIDPQWFAPALLRHEFINVLASNRKSGFLSLKLCEFIWQQIDPMMAGRLVELELFSVFMLAADKKISAYDAQFVALAQLRGAPLITEDRELVRKFPLVAFSIERYLKGREA